jgi:hypothetical protein
MPLYFFDTRDGDTFFSDSEGVYLPDLAAAKAIASASLAELAQDVIPGSERRVLIVEVRDGKRAVLEARLSFEAIFLVD